MRGIRWAVAACVVLGLFAGCGDDDGASAESPESGLAVPWVDPDGDPPIIGSLSVSTDPPDQTIHHLDVSEEQTGLHGVHGVLTDH